MPSHASIPILESGMTPVPGKTYRLIERFEGVQVVNDPYVVENAIDEATGKPTLRERKVHEGLFRLRGVFQRSDVRNANKRIYPRSIWEKWLREDSDLMKKVRENQCFGQIEHPKDGVGNLRDYAVRVNELTLQSDGTVLGEIAILDTNEGRILRDLVRSGVKIGVSSRGTGSVGSDGVVDERTFRPETWDVVGNPSTPGAFPEVVDSDGKPTSVVESKHSVCTLVEAGRTVWEVRDRAGKVVKRYQANVNVSKPKIGESMSTTKERFNTLKTHVSAHLSSDIDETAIADLSVIDQALTESSIQLGSLMEEDGSLKAVGDDLQRDISERRKIIKDAIAEKARNGKISGQADEACDDDEEDEDEDDMDETVDVAEAIDCLLEARAEIVRLRRAVEEGNDAISDITERLAEAETAIASLNEEIAIRDGMIGELTSVPDTARENVSEAIEAVMISNKGMEAHRSLFERCATEAEVTTLAEQLSVAVKKPLNENQTPGTISSAIRSNSLPPIGGRGIGSTGDLNENRMTASGEATPRDNGSGSLGRMMKLTESATRAFAGPATKEPAPAAG